MNEANFVFETPPKELAALAASEHAAEIICIDDDGGVQNTTHTSVADAVAARKAAEKEKREKRISSPVMSSHGAGKTSIYWKYFTQYVSPEYKAYAVCKICYEQQFGVPNQTCSYDVKIGDSLSASKLSSHLISHHNDLYKQLLDIKATAAGPMDSFAHHKNQKDQLEALTKFIVRSYKPISIVSDKYFRDYLTTVNPKVTNILIF